MFPHEDILVSSRSPFQCAAVVMQAVSIAKSARLVCTFDLAWCNIQIEGNRLNLTQDPCITDPSC